MTGYLNLSLRNPEPERAIEMDEHAPCLGGEPVGDEGGQPFPQGPFVWTRPGSPLAIQHHLGRKLQGMYAQIQAAPMPDRLAQLLNQMDATCLTD